MKMAFYLGAMVLLLAGCASNNKGGTGNESETTYGTASEMRSPGGLDRAKGTNQFGAMPEMEPISPGGGVQPQ